MVWRCSWVYSCIFPSSQRRGGCAIKKMMRSHRSGADGVVAHTQRFLCSHSETLSVSDHPVRAFSERVLLLDGGHPSFARRGMCCPDHSSKRNVRVGSHSYFT